MANEARNNVNANEDLFDFFGISNDSQDFNFFGDSAAVDTDTPANDNTQAQEPETSSDEQQNDVESEAVSNDNADQEQIKTEDTSTDTNIEPEPITNTAAEGNNGEAVEPENTANTEQEPAEKKTRRRRRKSADDIKVGKIDSVRSKDNAESTEVFTVPIDPNMSINSIISGLGVMPEPDFMANKEEIERKMREIQIERNLDRANIALMYERIDELSDMLRAHYAFAKSFYDNITNKDIGLIANVKKLNTVGSGTIPEKERNAILSLMNYKNETMDTPVNLIQAAWAANYQFNFIQSALDQIETKRRILRGVEDAVLGRS